MELLQELLLTAGISLVLAFLLAKLVSIAAPGAERDYAGNLVPLADLGLKSTKVVSSPGETTALVGETREGLGEFETVRRGPLLDQSIGIENEDPRGDEKLDAEEDDVVVVDGVERSTDVGTDDLNLTRVKEEEGRSGMDDGRLEVDLGKEMPEEAAVRNFHGILAAEESALIDDIKLVNLSDDHSVDTGLGGKEIERIDVELMKPEEALAEDFVDEVVIVRSAKTETTERIGAIEIGTVEKSELRDNRGEMYNEDDDWEGIERSEIEKLFGVATTFSGSDGSNAVSRLASDVQMQLYGLHKIATEGPCYEPQPLALKLSARAKWHAWQKLGNMNPEEAMEQYITILSESIPGWKGGEQRDDSIQESGCGPPREDLSNSGTPLLSSLRHTQLNLEAASNPVDHPYEEIGSATIVSQHADQGSAEDLTSSISLNPQ